MKDSKEHILKTAFNLFLRKNYKEVTMKEIVTESGLSKGAVYHYFVSKEQLFIDVINTFFFERMIVDYSKLNQNSLWEFYHDYVEYIQNVFGGSMKEFSNSESVININYITIMFDALKLFPDFQNKIIKMQHDELESWTKVIKQSRDKGEFFSPMTDDQIARMFIYSNDGIALHLMLEGKFEEAFPEMLNLWDNFYKEIKN